MKPLANQLQMSPSSFSSIQLPTLLIHPLSCFQDRLPLEQFQLASLLSFSVLISPSSHPKGTLTAIFSLLLFLSVSFLLQVNTEHNWPCIIILDSQLDCEPQMGNIKVHSFWIYWSEWIPSVLEHSWFSINLWKCCWTATHPRKPPGIFPFGHPSPLSPMQR